MGDMAVRAEGLTKRFGEVTALDHLDFEVAPGEVVGYLGPNGAGKTTTIRLMLGLAQPTCGALRDLRPRLPAPDRSRLTGAWPTWPGRPTSGRR